jgi:hypothetical protein
LDDKQPQRYAAMASLLAAAFAAGHMIYLNTAPPPDIRRALEDAGVEFIDANGGRSGR